MCCICHFISHVVYKTRVCVCVCVRVSARARSLSLSRQGKWLSQLVTAISAEKVLELGTFTGYSSTCIASALPPNGRLFCADIRPVFLESRIY